MEFKKLYLNVRLIFFLPYPHLEGDETLEWASSGKSALADPALSRLPT